MADASHYHSELGDGLHQNVAWNNDSDEYVATTDFDYPEIDRNVFGYEGPETQVDFSDMSAALCLILEWICASPNLKHCGGRAAALMCMIDPVQAPHDRNDLTTIAKECDVTKQAVSKWLCDLRDQTGVSLGVGKKPSMRARYREAQIAAMERGSHASFVRKDRQKQAA